MLKNQRGLTLLELLAGLNEHAAVQLVNTTQGATSVTEKKLIEYIK
ncbi:hypothetical protein [Metabacillus sediminilitoris]|nr:hypothetical protein [Metabacillus sediminilitoris]QGQ47419.1 hypothetical protein GMB29_20445 [Metabacillus sediminilitoris]